MLISAPFFSSLLYKDDTNCFLDTNHNGKLTVVRILLKVTLIILTIPILPNCVTFIWALSQVPITSSLKLIKFSTVENLNSFDVLYQKTDDFGNWKDLTINLTKAANDSKYSHYIIYTGQGNQLTNSLVVQSLTNVEFFFDTYQVSNISRVGTAYAKILNATTIKLTMLEGVASGDGVVKIIAFKKV